MRAGWAASQSKYCLPPLQELPGFTEEPPESEANRVRDHRVRAQRGAERGGYDTVGTLWDTVALV